MKVIDAFVVVELVAYDLDPDVLGDESLAAPHLIDCEVLQSLRGLELGGELTADTAFRALADSSISRAPGVRCVVEDL